MSKELEALRDDLIKITTVPIMDGELYALEFRKKVFKIIKALTPPTEEEVCEALGEYLNRKVTYYNRSFYYQFRNELGDGSYYIASKEYDNTVHIDRALPPKLGKMIYWFYEELEEKRNE